MKPINYTSDQAKDYSDALPKCKTLAELMSLLESYHMICPDALQRAPTNEAEFIEFMSGLRKEKRGEFAGEQFIERFGAVLLPDLLVRFGAVLLPDLLVRVATTAVLFGVPWGGVRVPAAQGAREHPVADDGVAEWVPETHC